MSVAQLPFSNSERCVGLPPAAGAELPPSKLSLVLHTIGPINTTQVMTGLLVDEWVEFVPNTRTRSPAEAAGLVRAAGVHRVPPDRARSGPGVHRTTCPMAFSDGFDMKISV